MTTDPILNFMKKLSALLNSCAPGKHTIHNAGYHGKKNKKDKGNGNPAIKPDFTVEEFIILSPFGIVL
jgi:hypothetical protein